MLFLRVFNKCTLITRLAGDISTNQMCAIPSYTLYTIASTADAAAASLTLFYYSCFAVRMYSMDGHRYRFSCVWFFLRS